MIISDDQARLVAKCLREGTPPAAETGPCDVEPSVLEAARDAVRSAPEVRSDRVEAAVVWLKEGDMDSRLIAEKMMCRIMSDWLR
jgi:hypothetical protein